jgi:hypothetical protein
MSDAAHPWTSRLARVLAALPILSLALAAAAWLRYGIDMPWFDDWRGYAAGTIDSLDLHYLFRPMNDTMSPVGLALDALAQRFLDGNSIAYQFLSMVTVLGYLLLLQWKLLNRTLGERWQVALCFLFTVLMLQPDSYWGLENLAYYQALPLVFIMLAMWLLTGPALASMWRGPAVALLALLAGMTYISGAFAAFAAGVTSLLLTRILHAGIERRQRMIDWAWFTVAAGVTVAAQFYFSVLKFRGTHAGIPLAMPYEAQFWAFYLGKIGRSLLLPASWPLTSLILTLLVCAVSLASAVRLLRRAISPAGTVRERQVVSVLVPLGALVFVYLLLVAAGRTNFRPPEMQDLMEIFGHGFTRFHFFWVTLIWPWVVAALLVLGSRIEWLDRNGPWWCMPVGLVIVALVVEGGGFDHMAQQEQVGENRARLAQCLLKELQKGGEVRCQGLLPPRYSESAPDAFPAYLYAKKIGASFVRNFPTLPPGDRRESIAPFYQLDANGPAPRMHEMQALGHGSFRSLGDDPQLFIQTNKPQITRHCLTLDVEVEINVPRRDTLQLYYVPAGDDEEYSGRNVVTETVGGADGSMQTHRFRLESSSGFFESLRLDPVTRPMLLDIPSIKVYCVRELP